MVWEDPSLSRVEAVIAFLESLPITKGILAGKTMQLLPHQIAFIEMLYGADPQPKLGIMSLPRGNGKTALIANLALCHLLGPEAEARGAVYSAATDRAQAALTFAEIEATIAQSRSSRRAAPSVAITSASPSLRGVARVAFSRPLVLTLLAPLG